MYLCFICRLHNFRFFAFECLWVLQFGKDKREKRKRDLGLWKRSVKKTSTVECNNVFAMPFICYSFVPKWIHKFIASKRNHTTAKKANSCWKMHTNCKKKETIFFCRIFCCLSKNWIFVLNLINSNLVCWCGWSVSISSRNSVRCMILQWWNRVLCFLSSSSFSHKWMQHRKKQCENYAVNAFLLFQRTIALFSRVLFSKNRKIASFKNRNMLRIASV